MKRFHERSHIRVLDEQIEAQKKEVIIHSVHLEGDGVQTGTMIVLS